MSARILDGKKIAADFLRVLAERSQTVAGKTGRKPHLVAVLVGDDPASRIYVRNKERACERAGVQSTVEVLPGSTTEPQLVRRIEELNADAGVDGILVQLPLPKGICEETILRTVSPDKDVDCFHPLNRGLLAEGAPVFLPCTPAAVLEILRQSHIPLEGANVVVVGRSNVVGKPLAVLLIQKDVGATVTICHTQTRNLSNEVRRADVVVAAAGRAGLVAAEMLKPGAVVIDVGTNRLDDGRVVGDVDFHAALEVASAITPVPGGVGPMTCAMVVRNTIEAAARTAALKGVS
jgi:methylenetetrahydrofolate dehydrogenase (NADP+)/methenyltetrahydrofolate cyclohydrolase